MNKKIWIPKLNIYNRLSRFQENLWNELMDNPFMGIVDNVAGLKFRKLAYNDIGPKRHFFTVKSDSCCDECAEKKRLMQYAVSSYPYGTISASGIVSGLTTQIDRGSDQFDTDNDSPPNGCLAYGYNATGGGEDYLASVGAMGTMDVDQYSDGGGTTRTIKAVYYTEICPGGANDDTFYFSLDGANIPDTDTTWAEIDWDDTAGTPQTIDRSAVTTYTASLNISTHWRWINATPNWGNTNANTDFVLTTS